MTHKSDVLLQTIVFFNDAQLVYMSPQGRNF